MTSSHVRTDGRTVRSNPSQYCTRYALKTDTTASTSTSSSDLSARNKVETHIRRGGGDNKNTVKTKSVTNGRQKANESTYDNYHEYDFSDEEVQDNGDKYKNVLDQVYIKMNSNKKCKKVLSNKKWKALIESDNEDEIEVSVEEDMFDDDDMLEIKKRENDVENDNRKKKSNDDISMKRYVKKSRTANKPTNIDTENENVENVRKQSKKVKSDLVLPADPEPSRTQDSIAFSFSDVIINSPPPGQLGSPNRPDPRCRTGNDESLSPDPIHLSINDLRNKRRHYFGLQSNRNREAEVENTVIVRPAIQIVTNTEICIPEIGQKRRFGLSAFEKQIPCTHTISDSDDNEKKINEDGYWDEIGIKKSEENNDFESRKTDSITHSRKNNKNSFLSSLTDEPKDLTKTKKQAINPFIIPQIKNKDHDMED